MVQNQNIPETVTIKIPVGMTAEKAQKLADKFVTDTEHNKKRNKAVYDTFMALKRANEPQYQQLLVKNYKAQGLDPATLK